jgi:drug/metabolite transporter (DMT)-like permease
MTEAQRQQRLIVIFAFALVYLFWGSTYLGIRIAIEHIPPALMCATRFLLSGVLMLGYCAFTGHKIRYSAGQLGQMAIVGILLLTGGNLTLSYAEEHVSSGLAALILASTPLWFLVLDTLLLGDHHIAPRAMIGLGLGVVGIVVLLWPKLTGTGLSQMWASLSLLFASFVWALGSVLSKRWQSSDVDPFSATAWQMLAAGLANLLIAVAVGDFSRVMWTARGIAAVCYLVICGSLIGYTAYIWLLAHVPTSKVSTYAYVNPVVAVFLGWLVLHEPVDAYIVAGSVIVIASVVLVTTSKVRTKTESEEMVEAAAD